MEADVAVLGGGPGGYTAAIRAAQLGLDVACIEAEDALGGTCVRVGCIPSKALLEASERYHAAGHDLADFGIKVAGVELDLARMLERKTKVVSQNTSPNITNALTNWTPVITNPFNSGGTFDYTNPIVPGSSQLFFDTKAVP